MAKGKTKRGRKPKTENDNMTNDEWNEQELGLGDKLSAEEENSLAMLSQTVTRLFVQLLAKTDITPAQSFVLSTLIMSILRVLGENDRRFIREICDRISANLDDA